METFVYTMGVISCLTSLVCGFSLTWVGVQYILSRDNLNIFQKGTYMIAYTYTAMIVGYLLTCALPIFLTALIINDAKFNFSFIKKYVSQSVNTKSYVEENVSPAIPTDTEYSPLQNDETVEQTEEQAEHSEACDCEEDSCQCNETICQANQCCRANFVASTQEEELNCCLNEAPVVSKSVLDVLKEEITQMHQSSEDDTIKKTD